VSNTNIGLWERDNLQEFTRADIDAEEFFRKRLTNYTVYGDRYFRAAQALGVSSATRLFGKSAKPGSTELR
jgi:hypothetical protein